VHPELTGDIGHDIRGHGGGMRQKRPQKPYRPQLEGKAQARVIALAALNELAIPVIKVAIARSLRWRWLFGIASVTALLLLGQELDRHASPLRTLFGFNPFSQTVRSEHAPKRISP
jgi:hypothetical protein